MGGFYTFVAIASLIFVLITYFLGRFFKDRAIIKYIPAIISAFCAVGFLIKAKVFSTGTGFEDLGYIVLMLIAGIVFFASLLTAIIMELLQRKNRQNN